MEQEINSDSPQAPSKFKKWLKYSLLIIVAACFTYIVGSAIYSLYLEQQKNLDLAYKYKSESDSLQILYKGAFDSLEKFSNYKTLYNSIDVRDNTTKQLKYKYGDIVYCKPDSSKYFIEDIIIGGSKYNHYIKYKIKDKTTSLEVIPEQLY